jgi:RNA polymerase sigma-70 factor, ECF subfamily
VVYIFPGGGYWPAVLYRTMCTTLAFLDGPARSALLSQARKGDRESVARLILPYAPAMYLGALRMTRNPADAEDVRQESFLKAMTRLDQFVGTAGANRDDLHAWVSRIATNASIDMIRKRRDGKLFSLEEPNGATGDETLGTNMTAPEDNPEQRCARREMRMLMAQAITQLAPDLRQACLLRDVLQYSTQEVAERLGISAMAVRLRLFRAHRRLREKLSVARQPAKQLQACSSAARLALREEVRKRQQRVPLAAFAECACGD